MGGLIPLLVVGGPTASGKTGLAIDLALRFGGEVVCADSMQVYRGMDIGTAAPTAAELARVPHHLFGILDPGERFSVADYVRRAGETIDSLHARGVLPVLCGGTGLYIQSLIDNVRFQEMPESRDLRSELEKQYDQLGAQRMHERLRDCDPVLADKLHPNNRGRVIRALEVFALTGTPLSEWQRRSREQPSPYRTLFLAIGYRDRQKLYERIDRRVDGMLEQGLLDEARAFLRRGYGPTAFQAIGYKELAGYLEGKQTLDEAADTIKQQTRRYAKRQMTWLRADERIHWLWADECDSYSLLLEQAARIVERSGIREN